MMCNKKYNLIYGKLLKEITNKTRKAVKILYYKIPSQIHKVDYKEIVNELRKTEISDDAEEDKFLKKGLQM